MRIQDKCLPCIVNQTIKVAELVGIKDKDELLRQVFTYLSNVDFNQCTTPELIGEIFVLIKKITGNSDPYKETRDYYNRMFLKQLPELEQEISLSDYPLLEAIKFAQVP